MTDDGCASSCRLGASSSFLAAQKKVQLLVPKLQLPRTKVRQRSHHWQAQPQSQQDQTDSTPLQIRAYQDKNGVPNATRQGSAAAVNHWNQDTQEAERKARSGRGCVSSGELLRCILKLSVTLLACALDPPSSPSLASTSLQFACVNSVHC